MEPQVATNPKGLPQSEVGEEDVCLLDIAYFPLHLLAHSPGVQQDLPAGEGGVACQCIQESRLASTCAKTTVTRGALSTTRWFSFGGH